MVVPLLITLTPSQLLCTVPVNFSVPSYSDLSSLLSFLLGSALSSEPPSPRRSHLGLPIFWADLFEAPPGGHAPLTPPPLLFAVHGQFSVAVRGCGSGIPGKNDRGLDLYGILAFIQLQQCPQDRCNAKLNLTSRALNPAGRWGRSHSSGGRSHAWAERLGLPPAGGGKNPQGLGAGSHPGGGVRGGAACPSRGGDVDSRDEEQVSAS